MDTFEKNLEADIAQLAERVKNLREVPEMKNASEAEILKEAMKVFPRPGAEKPPVPTPTQPANQVANTVLPDYAANASPEVKLEIEYLIDVAFRHGIDKALAEAQKSSPFVEDAVRDALAGKLYPTLQERGIVK
jgi:LPS O-antigen subunit length determinant protein (WzzB/FepE family)